METIKLFCKNLLVSMLYTAFYLVAIGGVVLALLMFCSDSVGGMSFGQKTLAGFGWLLSCMLLGMSNLLLKFFDFRFSKDYKRLDNLIYWLIVAGTGYVIGRFLFGIDANILATVGFGLFIVIFGALASAAVLSLLWRAVSGIYHGIYRFYNRYYWRKDKNRIFKRWLVERFIASGKVVGFLLVIFAVYLLIISV